MATLAEQIDSAVASWVDRGEIALETGLDYGDGEHVRVTLR